MLHHPMRRTKNQIRERSEILAVIRQSPVMRLALCLENEPYVVPLSFGCDGEALYFHSAPAGLKVDILRRNPRVCCLFEHGLALDPKGLDPCQWGFVYTTAIVHGTAIQILDRQARLKALQLITDHYAENSLRVPEDKIEGVEVWKIEILEMTGKRAG
ncbi:MAG: pyridoxamine 5'-phosphate oxidase family protein [Desulfomicrobium sp.]|nr:pyridoxamine 5'-phosphate oxidase family protein [Pseudomonadota bacterium]MBU4569725.1 pyridoxamine 5'-phosphate oxidase family protein [Pseudomonadota bacterium]MBV1711661.1 pyridoxamine 5'-phosphate oxidase family protein [Desulfomicrobium sp.]MBV1718736.1 pyridoxamine 5'-phosphate oxidase family protein [Desulfomicrobium sp.]MBV1747220.1 pyridoxamine 5'-phosphate oxidase family protein [Desulfomicrobium sp.]